MRFGPVPVDEAAGAILAHSTQLPGARLRKGRVLSAEDVAALAGAGHDSVTVARPDPGEIGEDPAADRLAAALLAPGLRASRAATGRANLYARGKGVLRIDRAAVDALNRVHPMITLATVPEWYRADAGTMLATIKIISYAVPEEALDRAAAAGRGAFAFHRVARRRARLIQTVTGDRAGKSKAVHARLAALGLESLPERSVPHETGALARALAAEVEADLVLILTGSATSDIDDVAPAALVAAGGRVDHFGMPVDPGNLLFLGALGDRPVIGLPGCARSPARNGADWVLERVACGVPVDGADIAGMGVGGLLKETPDRGRPREG
ncbi:molybdopterin-binding protein [Wenxinia saemankumensis]|uniref:Molybdenum cofactor cytidylyltransferase n=1 Tax=Wenxinia saemankumensis TaxID=1447782 RepID=A0A1M6AYF7_9RHOB|nr:molybdopterin-binding protein [Wenxinia saemankumensis]SHI41505.1 molybdenum cofactor cytidylyltransferase [Wenxinia saemankumensis]